MRLHLTDAMTVMAEAMTAVSASRRQVSGVARWRDLIAAMTDAREDAEQAMGTATLSRTLQADVPGAGTHRDWRESATAICRVLGGNAGEASRRQAAATQRAVIARQDALDARHAQQEALMEAATALHEGIAAAWREQAQACADQARAADQSADRDEHIARQCAQWYAAADAARWYGKALTRREDAIHVPVGEAIAAAGGQAWIAADKQFLEEAR